MNFFVFPTPLALAVAAVLSLTAHAQAPYPNQGIRFIVPYAPGGLPDTVARIVARDLQERIGQSVVVENRAGGGAAAAVSALMGAPADGYTFLVTDGGIVSTNPALFKQLTYNPKDIVPLALLGRAPMFLAAHSDLPVSTLREFIAYVKARPGEINYGSSGVGSIHHLSMEVLKVPLQLKMAHIPYRGTGQVGPGASGRSRPGAVRGLSVVGGRGRKQEGQTIGTERRGPLVPSAGRARGLRGGIEFRSGDHRRALRAPRGAASVNRQDH